MGVQYEEVKNLWDGVMFVHGLSEVARLMEYEYENIRELLTKVRAVWKDNRVNFTAVMETIQTITVLQGMTFYAQMGSESEISSFTCFCDLHEIAEGEDPPCSLREKLASLLPGQKEIVMEEMKSARRDVKSLTLHAQSMPNLQRMFCTVEALLDDVITVAKQI